MNTHYPYGKYIEDVQDIIMWAETKDANFSVAEAEASLIMEYADDIGCRLVLNYDYWECILLDAETGAVDERLAFSELLERIIFWIEDLNGMNADASAKQFGKNMISNLLERNKVHEMVFTGNTTVLELQNLLRELPEDYIICCTGLEDFWLHTFHDEHRVVIDTERFLG